MAATSRSDQPPSLQRFLLADERVVVAVHQHWGRIAGPIAATLGGLLIVLFFDAHVTYPNGTFMRALWILWLVLVGWMIWQLAEWRSDWFLATDKRLLLRYGLLTRKVAMMPLMKVTDMSYNRSVPGRFFGYGRFVLESAGQDQALRTIEWVPRPDDTYRVICAEIFGVVDVDDLGPGHTASGDDGWGGGSGPGNGDDDNPPPPRSPLPISVPGQTPGQMSGQIASQIPSPLSGALQPESESAVDDHYTHSRAIPLHRDPRISPAGASSGEIIYSSDGERRRRREAKTGPLDPQPGKSSPGSPGSRRRPKWPADD